MKKNSIYWIVGFVVLSIVLFLSYITMHPIFAFKLGIKKAAQKYGKAISANCEKIFRLESGNFKSGQWIKTYSPGMQNATSTYPYGWTSLKSFWDSNPDYKPIGFEPFTENATGNTVTFISFKSVEAAIMTLCEFLKAHDNNAGRWFSTDEGEQASYQAKLDNIKAEFNDLI